MTYINSLFAHFYTYINSLFAHFYTNDSLNSTMVYTVGILRNLGFVYMFFSRKKWI